MKLGINDNWIYNGQHNGRHNDVMIAAGPGPLGPWNLGDADKVIHYAVGPPPVGYHCMSATLGYARTGKYTLKATGKGQLKVGLSGPGTHDMGTLATGGLATFTGAETYTFGLAANQYFDLTVTATDATAPLDKIQALAPGAGPGLYHPAFLDALRGFDTIRFDDPMNAPGSQMKVWADRVTRPGEDIESLIALCNQLHCHGWFCLPAHTVRANTTPGDFASEIGALLNSRLDPDLTAFVELSDEIWNWSFPYGDETGYIYGQGVVEYLPLGGPEAVVRLAHSIFNAVQAQVDPACGPKIRRVFAAQLGNDQTIRTALPYAVKHGLKFDVVAGGYYWGCLADTAAIKAAWAAGDRATAMKLIDDGFRAGVERTIGWHNTTFLPTVRACGNLPVVAYEGGPSTGLWNDATTLPIIDAYTDDPLCKQQHLDAFKAFDGIGLELFCYYSYCHPGGGVWSSRDNADDNTNQRYVAMRAYLTADDAIVALDRDATTKGTWIGKYGSMGAVVAGAPATAPATAEIGATSTTTTPALPAPTQSLYTWAASTTLPRAPQLPDGSGRVAAAWYGQIVEAEVPADGPCTLSLYLLGWGDNVRAAVVNVYSLATGMLIDSQPVGNFGAGLYLRWRIARGVKVQLVRTAGANAVLSGIFLDA